MAIIESDYGRSRFAVEGNALFGVRTWSLDKVPHMKPARHIPILDLVLKKYKTKCQSVEDVIDIINRHPAYEPFRLVRDKNRYAHNITQMVFGLSAWSTNEEYPQIILQKIEQLTNK
jgi:Bax protein